MVHIYIGFPRFYHTWCLDLTEHGCTYILEKFNKCCVQVINLKHLHHFTTWWQQWDGQRPQASIETLLDLHKSNGHSLLQSHGQDKDYQC